jgi:hypothetical protein
MLPRRRVHNCHLKKREEWELHSIASRSRRRCQSASYRSIFINIAPTDATPAAMQGTETSVCRRFLAALSIFAVFRTWCLRRWCARAAGKIVRRLRACRLVVRPEHHRSAVDNLAGITPQAASTAHHTVPRPISKDRDVDFARPNTLAG